MPDDRFAVNERGTTTNNYYASWPLPWGGWLCGVSFVAIGVGLVLQDLFPGRENLVWASLLIGVGGVVLWQASRSGEERWTP